MSSTGVLLGSPEKTFCLCALAHFYTKYSSERGFVRHDFIKRLYGSIQEHDDPFLLQTYDMLCGGDPQSLEQLPTKSVLYKYLRDLEKEGLVEVWKGYRYKIRPTPHGMTIAHSVFDLHKIDGSKFGIIMKNLVWDVSLNAEPKFTKRLKRKMLRTISHVRYEKYPLRDSELVFVYTNNKRVYDERFGKKEFVFLASGIEIDSDMFDVEDVTVETLDGEKFELEKTYDETYPDSIIKKFYHPRLENLKKHPVRINYKVNFVTRRDVNNLSIKPPHPTWGLTITVDYETTDIPRVIPLDPTGGKLKMDRNPSRGKVKASLPNTELVLPPQAFSLIFGGEKKKCKGNR
jgi:hypothetical protein